MSEHDKPWSSLPEDVVAWTSEGRELPEGSRKERFERGDPVVEGGHTTVRLYPRVRRELRRRRSQ